MRTMDTQPSLQGQGRGSNSNRLSFRSRWKESTSWVSGRRAERSAPMVTQVQDGTDSDAGCMRCEPAGLGMNQDLAGHVDHLSPAQKNARVRELLIVRAMR